MNKTILLTGIGIITAIFTVSSLNAEESDSNTVVDSKNTNLTIKKINDWCTIICPKEAAVGDKITIKLKLGNFSELGSAIVMNADLHWYRPAGYAGFLKWGGASHEIKVNKECILKYRIPPKKGVSSVVVFFYFSKNGDLKKAKLKFFSPKIKIKK